MPRLRQALPGVLTFAHQAFELLAGSGVIGQRHIGLVPAAALAIAADAGCVAAAADRRQDWHRILAVAAGTALGAPPLHYTLFPWRVRWGLPVLAEAEGLRGAPVAGYVALLYGWAAAGAVSALGVPRGHRRWILVGIGGAAVFRQVAADHLTWIRPEAERNPAWWNRAWRERGLPPTG